MQNAIEIVIFILNTSQTGKHRRFLDWINKSSLPAAGFFFPFLTKSFTIKEKTEKQKGGRILIAQEIKLRIHEESDLFSPFDPDRRILSEDAISYLNINYEAMFRKKKGTYAIHVFSDTPVNENHIKDAIREHCSQEMENIRFISKIETFKELSLGLLGSVILTLWFVLSNYTEGVYLEILTIIGWVAIWEAAGGALIKRPELYHQKKLYDLASKAEIIIEAAPHDRS